MRTKKNFDAPAPIAIVTTPTAESGPEADNSLVIALPENSTGWRTIDLTPWLNQGIDAWVYACAGQLRTYLRGKNVAPTTVAHYWTSGLRYFFEFLVVTQGPSEPAALEPRTIRRLLGWVSAHRWSYGTQRGRYTHIKSVLLSLSRRQIIPAHEDLFPVNPFPRSNSQLRGEEPLSSSERMRVANALRNDLIASHRDQFQGPESHALVVLVMAVAIRCGANPTPLLEAKRDCLQDHPFMPNMKRLVLFKRRGKGTRVVQLRYSKEVEDSVSVAMDGVALVQKAQTYSAHLVSEAAPEHRDRLFLYRSVRKSKAAGNVVPLSGAMLTQGIAAFITRNDLHGDDGKPLRLNLSRLRKTVEMRLFDLSGGDLIATAALMGHSPKVADMHYLACTQQMRENATFVGEALPDIYRNGSDTDKIIPILPEKTPTGRCSDPYKGDRAPKDGTACDDFLACFSCTSYAITGSPDDLYRLFSFYFFLEREMHRARSEEWRTEFRHTMLLIERFTADKFDVELVAVARERAHTEPLGFWAGYTL